MNTRDDLDGRLDAWFTADAVREPEHLLGAVLARTARTRRRPAWLIPERWLPVTAITSRTLIGGRVSLRLVGVLALLVLALVAATIYIAGNQPRRLPPPFGVAGNGRMAYVSNGEIYVANPEGRDPAALTADGRVKGIPTWSRTGTLLAFLAYASPASTDHASLIVTRPDGTQPVTIVDNAEVLQFFSFSPDGATIAFSRWIDYAGQRDRIFIAPSDGSKAPIQIGDPDLSAFNPAFSPDGKLIAFQSDLSDPLNPAATGYALHVMNADGSNIRQLVQKPGFVGNGFEGRAWGVDWRPDGRQILLVINDGEGASTTSALYVVDVGGGEPRLIADEAGSEYGPAWSPDGSQIAFLRRDPTGKRSVVVAEADGSHGRILATDVAGFTPQWAPDGRSVAVIQTTFQSTATIRILRLDGSAPDIVLQIALGSGVSETTPGLDAIGWQRIAP